jgi:SpoVK/Ycf46/Vps4 family AAA+-type ATPase
MDYAGAEKLINEAKKIEAKMLTGIETKGFLIVGLPGTGKSFFAKCFAGETKRLLVELSFSKILESPRPLDKLTSVLNFFKNNPNKYLIWIDEIEKMFESENAQQILGVFLTELNEFSNSKSNVIFIATANNISGMATKNPEFFRTGGRFDKIIALMPPNEENAKKILKLYLNKYLKALKIKNFPFALINSLLNIDKNLFINTKIEDFTKELFNNVFDDFYKNLIIKDYQDYVNYIKNPSFLITKVDNSFKKEIDLSTTFDEKLIVLRRYIENNFLKTLEKISPLAKIKYEEFINKIFFNNNLDYYIQEIIQEVFTKYRSDSAISNRFPYTPAEISFFCNELYSNYYFNPLYKNERIETIIKDTINNVIPLQVQQKEAIEKMYAENKNFIEI